MIIRCSTRYDEIVVPEFPRNSIVYYMGDEPAVIRINCFHSCSYNGWCNYEYHRIFGKVSEYGRICPIEAHTNWTNVLPEEGYDWSEWKEALKSPYYQNLINRGW